MNFSISINVLFCNRKYHNYQDLQVSSQFLLDAKQRRILSGTSLISSPPFFYNIDNNMQATKWSLNPEIPSSHKFLAKNQS